jgi:hypothetical protein
MSKKLVDLLKMNYNNSRSYFIFYINIPNLKNYNQVVSIININIDNS